MRPDPCRPVNIVGAGLAGPLLSLMLARRGFSVVLYEKRSDPRRVRTQRGRSINLTLAARGINALERAGVMSGVAPLLIPMRGRMVHSTSRGAVLQLYGQREHEVIYSIQRVVLQRILIEEAARYPNITVRFDQKCIAADPKENRLTFRDKMHGKEYSVELAPTIATDGANSAVRASLVESGHLAAHVDMLDHGYKELTLPPVASGYALNSDALHLWPRGDFMLVAMPNPNYNITATLFLKNTGPVSFATLMDSQSVSEFFHREFPDAVPLIQNLPEQFSSNPQSRLGTVFVEPWHTKGAVLLLGDAAHAIVPFYGQGVNAAFEDCVVFDSLLDEHQQWAPLFVDFETVRRADANAIAQMSLENYKELCAAVLQPDFVLRKFLALELERRFPDRFIPQYSMVTFHPEISYAQAQRRGKIQEDILAELTLGEGSSAQHRLGITDFALAARLIHGKLPAFACDSTPNNASAAKWHDISGRPEASEIMNRRETPASVSELEILARTHMKTDDCDQIMTPTPVSGKERRDATDNEQQNAIELFNTTQIPYPKENLIHQLLEQQVERTPNAVALVYKDETLTYTELNSRANQLAHYLVRKGVSPDQLVGLYIERSVETIVAIFGILKAGGAYVPLDPGYPVERLEYMLRDAAPDILLARGIHHERLPPTSAKVISLEDLSEIGLEPRGNLDAQERNSSSNNLAYVIYTSGSTGQPKGVLVEHRHVLNLWQGLEKVYDKAAECRRVAVNASFNFDVSVQQTIQLLSGRAIIVVPKEYQNDVSMLGDYLLEHAVECIDCTISQLRSWIFAGLFHRARQLRLVLAGGEAIDVDLWRTLARDERVEFYNVYGPTECTVSATIAALKADETPPHIGRPMGNRRIYVLDAQLHSVPIGVTGEIYIGGEGVARGYLNQRELTTERFQADPFSDDPTARMYRTGDVGRWRVDGNIEYLGRNDHQVKIRGFRIELGEIERTLLRHEAIREAVVVVREDEPGEKRLVAYVTLKMVNAATDIAASLRNRLLETLPDYMVPTAFMVLEHLPLTPNGKHDRKALPAPDNSALVRRVYEAPQGETEIAIANIWSELLKLERVGRWDNFFELGGHSLLAVTFMERLRRLGLAANVSALFATPALSAFAGSLDELSEVVVPPNLIVTTTRDDLPPVRWTPYSKHTRSSLWPSPRPRRDIRVSFGKSCWLCIERAEASRSCHASLALHPGRSNYG